MHENLGLGICWHACLDTLKVNRWNIVGNKVKPADPQYQATKLIDGFTGLPESNATTGQH